MANRRRVPTDLAAARRSRSHFCGAVTRARDKFTIMKELDISDLNTRTIDRILSSLMGTETGFYSTIEDAQNLLKMRLQKTDKLKKMMPMRALSLLYQKP